MSQNNIATFFDVELRQQDVSNFSNQIRKELLRNFVSKNLGAENLSRSQLCEKNTEFIKMFCHNRTNKKKAFINF